MDLALISTLSSEIWIWENIIEFLASKVFDKMNLGRAFEAILKVLLENPSLWVLDSWLWRIFSS